MAGHNSPKKRTTSGISVNQQSNIDEYNVTGTVTLSRRSIGLSQEPAPQKSAPPPVSEIAKMPYSVATVKDVACPKCQDKYDITQEYYNTVTQCLKCKAYFVIRPPGTPPYRQPAGRRRPSSAPAHSSIPSKQKSTTSGIQVEKGDQGMAVTGTVLLSRSGMSMMQRRRGERKRAPQQSKAAPPPPPPAAVAGMIYSVATDRDVGCPKCNERFEISPEFYHAVAECPDCGCEFVIKPPGTPPHQPSVSPPRPGVPPPAPPKAAPAPTSTAKVPVPPPPPAAASAAPPAAAPAAPAPPPAAAPAAPAPPPANERGKKRLDPLVLGLFVAVVVLLVAIIVILLVVK